MATEARDLSDALLSRARDAVRVARRVVASVRNDERNVNLRIEIREDEVDGGFVVRCLDLPGCGSQGDTVQEAMENIIEAIAGVLEVRMQREAAEKPQPQPTIGNPQRVALKIP